MSLASFRGVTRCGNCAGRRDRCRDSKVCAWSHLRTVSGAAAARRAYRTVVAERKLIESRHRSGGPCLIRCLGAGLGDPTWSPRARHVGWFTPRVLRTSTSDRPCWPIRTRRWTRGSAAWVRPAERTADRRSLAHALMSCAMTRDRSTCIRARRSSIGIVSAVFKLSATASSRTD